MILFGCSQFIFTLKQWPKPANDKNIETAQYDPAEQNSNHSMSCRWAEANIAVQKLIEELEKVLSVLDELELALPAIKVEETINILKGLEASSSDPVRPES